jgi:hypothetical protein
MLERMMVSWLMTSITLIGFGFAIVMIFDQFSRLTNVAPPLRLLAPFHFGLLLIAAGVAGLVVAAGSTAPCCAISAAATLLPSQGAASTRADSPSTPSPSSRFSSACSRFSPSRHGFCDARRPFVRRLPRLGAVAGAVLVGGCFVRGALAVAFGITTARLAEVVVRGAAHVRRGLVPARRRRRFLASLHVRATLAHVLDASLSIAAGAFVVLYPLWPDWL